MDITRLLPLLDEMAAYRQLIDELDRADTASNVLALDSAKPYLIAALRQNLKRPLLVVCPQPEEAKNLREQLAAWCPPAEPRLLEEPDGLPYQHLAADTSTELKTLELLSALTDPKIHDPASLLLVTSALGLMQKLMPRRDFITARHTLKVGEEITPQTLLQRWQQAGYRLESLVEVPGSISHRGGILDIYPPPNPLPARIEFYGNTVESIRLFDPLSQRSKETVTEITITPATGLLKPRELASRLAASDWRGLEPATREQLEQDLALLKEGHRPDDLHFYAPFFCKDSILSYLPEGTLIILNEPRNLKATTQDMTSEVSELRAGKIDRGELPADFPPPYFSWEELKETINGKANLSLASWDSGGDDKSHRLSFTPSPGYAGQLTTLLKKVKRRLKQKHRLIIVSHQAERLSELLNEEDIIAPPLSEISRLPEPGSLTLVHGLLDKGWIMNGDTHLLTDYEIFGFIKERRTVKKHPVPRRKLLGELRPGDYVVHLEHGIARFGGVTKLEGDYGQKEYLLLKYAADDKLYVPTDQIARLSRYVGANDRPPALSRLGTQEWSRIKERTKESTRLIARELLALYASRETVAGYAFSPDNVWQQELEASFPYVETPDQIKVLGQVKADMAKPKPMDRLICGDVGYGKTEIAVRAAFKAVMDDKQVAVLVPTTVLAQQHALTFRQRLNAFPVRIEVLSRFKTPDELSDTLEGLAGGKVDICIGTHRLLQKDVNFKDLGLIIIDEEQRFGVTHKEYLKQKRHEVDVLTLSATPIPRTLHMSLVGIRDVSTMETPPEERLPIKTFVAQNDDSLIREAVLSELERNGQIFFVHNRVESIALIAAKLQVLVPEGNIGVAHGQMPENELAAVMADFTQGRVDVLVCTTIIESGLDMPNVNTLIVNRAERFGLTQLYQLRGRVGRGTNLAHAYFLYDRGRRLTPTAEKRLRTIFEATELGAGYDIALRDLEIRGAGTLLGTKQSGHISAVGFNLYTRLLAEAVEQEKTRARGGVPQPAKLPPPTIELPLPTYLPDSYVPDLNTRLGLYHRLAEINTADAVAALTAELNDRFGKPPEEVNNLLYMVRIKALAARAAVASITSEHGRIIIRPLAGTQFGKPRLKSLEREGLKVSLNQIRLSPRRLGKAWQEILEELLESLAQVKG